VNDFKCGLTLQVTGKTKLIEESSITAIKIKKVEDLSLNTAPPLFKLKISPTASFTVMIIWHNWTYNNLKRLDTVKMIFLEGIFLISKYTPTRTVYLLAGAKYFDIRTDHSLLNNEASEVFQRGRQAKQRHRTQKFSKPLQ
jgi:hypothetical protein